MSNAYPALCAKCRVSVKVWDDQVTCPICGASDSIENALRECFEQLAQEQIIFTMDAIFADSGGSPFIKTPESEASKRGYRFFFERNPATVH